VFLILALVIPHAHRIFCAPYYIVIFGLIKGTTFGKNDAA